MVPLLLGDGRGDVKRLPGAEAARKAAPACGVKVRVGMEREEAGAGTECEEEGAGSDKDGTESEEVGVQIGEDGTS